MAVFLLIFFVPSYLMAQTILISNFPLRKNNFESVINLQNYRELLQLIKTIDDIKDVYVMEEDDRVVIYIERYPILRRILVRGDRSISREEILSYLGFYEDMPLKEQDSLDVDLEMRIKRFYSDRGFLDAKVRVQLEQDSEGYVDLFVEIDEGPVYFVDEGIYKGSVFEPALLDLKVGLIRGKVFRENIFREGVFSLQDFYLKEGFWESFVFYEGFEKVKLNKPFIDVLLPRDRTVSRRPLRLIGALTEGISNLFGYPTGTLLALSGKGYVARPVFRIIEGKRSRLSWVGNSFFKAEELLNISGLVEKGVDPFSLEEARLNISRAYQRKGFFDVKVSYSVNREDILFTIEEGIRYVVRGSPFDGSPYDEDQLESYIQSELNKLLKEGFLLAQVSIKREVLKEEKRVVVGLLIDQGKKFKIKKFEYTGKNKDIRNIFIRYNNKLPAVYDPRLVESLNLELQRYFLRKGFMEGEYEVSTKIEESGNSIVYTFVYTIKEGPVYKAGQVLYYGYDKTTLRELSYMTARGQNYSEELNEATLNSMLNSGIFNGVSIQTYVDRENKVVHRVVQLSEDKRGLLDLSLGYNSQDYLTFEAFIGLQNLFGVGLSSGFRYRRTGREEVYDLGFQDGFFFSRKLFSKLNLFRSFEEHRSFDLKSTGLNLQLGYRITEHTSAGPSYSLLQNRVFGQTYNLSKFGLFLIREFRDDIFSPERVQYIRLNLNYALGKDDYTRADLSAFYLTPFLKNIRLSIKAGGGAVWGRAPIFDRFFLGGLRDLRGYSYEEIGQPSGGKYYTFGRLEFIFTAKEPFLLVLFGDAGNVYDRLKDLKKELKHNVGTGAGVNTPIGPVRFDLAFPTSGGQNWLKNYKVYLSIGYYY